MPPLADLIAFEEWLGRPVDDTTRAAAILDAASSLVRSETDRTWVDDQGDLEDVPNDVRSVVLQVTRRVYLNPDGFQSERQGDYAYNFPTTGPGGLRLEPHERSILGRYRTSQRGLWTLSTTRGDRFGDTVFVPVVDAPPFPWYAGDVP